MPSIKLVKQKLQSLSLVKTNSYIELADPEVQAEMGYTKGIIPASSGISTKENSSSMRSMLRSLRQPMSVLVEGGQLARNGATSEAVTKKFVSIFDFSGVDFDIRLA